MLTQRQLAKTTYGMAPQAPTTPRRTTTTWPDRNDESGRVVDVTMTTWGFIGSGNIGTSVAMAHQRGRRTTTTMRHR